ncbi:MAG TPA: hypothetical protein VFP43_16690, partial [Mesorhizobium sp.]|nr:hypothetical protein [Mesorhizobium sp.]
MHAGDNVLSGGDGNDALQGGGNDVFGGGGEDSASFANITGHVWAALGPPPTAATWFRRQHADAR